MDESVENKDIENPFVSIISPAFNVEEFVDLICPLLINQTYPKDLYEIIIVDNNSSDQTLKKLEKYSDGNTNFYIIEQHEVQGSYASRNAGLEKAKGRYIAFIDMDCQPEANWLEQGVSALNRNDVDLVGGNVDFLYSPKPTGAEIFDSISNMQIKENIQERKVAKTANLFVKRSVFDSIGNFDSGLKSGGDVLWTKKATDNGFNLVYTSEAIVKHPTRNFQQLIEKQIRVARGKYHLLKKEKNFVKALSIELLRNFKPPMLGELKKQLIRKGKEQFLPNVWSLWVVIYCIKLVTIYGLLAEAVFPTNSVAFSPE